MLFAISFTVKYSYYSFNDFLRDNGPHPDHCAALCSDYSILAPTLCVCIRVPASLYILLVSPPSSSLSVISQDPIPCILIPLIVSYSFFSGLSPNICLLSSSISLIILLLYLSCLTICWVLYCSHFIFNSRTFIWLIITGSSILIKSFIFSLICVHNYTEELFLV